MKYLRQVVRWALMPKTDSIYPPKLQIFGNIIFILFLASVTTCTTIGLYDYYSQKSDRCEDESFARYVGEVVDRFEGNSFQFTGSVDELKSENGTCHGQGTLSVLNIFSDERPFPVLWQYVGEFKNGIKTGQGTKTNLSGPHRGMKYVGEFKDGEFHGKGKITLTDGTVYVGEFKDGEFHGKGKITSTDGSKYVGEFKDGKYHGGAKRVVK